MQLYLLANLMMGKKKVPDLLYYAKDEEADINRRLRKGLVPRYCDSVAAYRKNKNIFFIKMKRGPYVISAPIELQFHTPNNSSRVINFLVERTRRQRVSRFIER